MAEKKKPERDSKSERFSMRMYGDDYNRLVYWADRFGMDKTELLVASMDHYIRWKNGDYDLPSAEIQRLNQLIDAVQNLITQQQEMMKMFVSGFDAIIGMARGDNYLVDDENGDL